MGKMHLVTSHQFCYLIVSGLLHASVEEENEQNFNMVKMGRKICVVDCMLQFLHNSYVETLIFSIGV